MGHQAVLGVYGKIASQPLLPASMPFPFGLLDMKGAALPAFSFLFCFVLFCFPEETVLNAAVDSLEGYELELFLCCHLQPEPRVIILW